MGRNEEREVKRRGERPYRSERETVDEDRLNWATEEEREI